ncbi:MAG TPA: GHKL domain-containing protein [Clostridia bacterium]|nr:GHKL domain-containing protein [Clostridia bacterium]
MEMLFVDILRAIVSTTGNVVLMLSLLQPKYGKRVTGLAMLGVLSADLGTALFCYISGNLTLLAKIDTVLFAVVCFAVKPLFKDNFMQWLFSYITIQNISDIVIILSFILSRRLPYPPYANVAIRLVMFLFFYWLLRFKVRPLYRQMVERWTVFFYVALAVWATFTYYVVTSDDIVVTLTEQAAPMLLIIAVTLTAYASVLHCLYNLRKEYRLEQDKTFLQLSGETMKQRLSIMDESVRQMSVVQHDQRHLNATLLELIQNGQTDKAAALIAQQTEALPQKPARYCDNIAMSAAVSYYAAMAAQRGIRCDLQLDIPEDLTCSELGLAMVVSNLMENAIHACEKLNPDRERYLRVTAVYTGQLILAVENPYSGEVTLDENGYPVAMEEGHGRGSESIRAFVKETDGEIYYAAQNGVFKVRLLV